LVTLKTAKKRAQVQPTAGPKWAFGNVLREARQGKGLSQERLAEAAGLDRSFISLIERGIQTPNVVVLFKVSEVLGVSASALIGEVERILQTAHGPTEAPGVLSPAGKLPRQHRG
jgi:transcriptional regulator with XRE-family HTH domain